MDPIYCEECRGTENLVKHHTSYYPEKTKWVCRSCHQKIHANKKIRPLNYVSKNEVSFNVKISQPVKDRLKRFTKENKISQKQVVIQMLNNTLPEYKE